MRKILLALVGTVLAFNCLSAFAGNDKADIKVMTQNQYLGADLRPIMTAATELEYATAVASALQSVAANNFQERVLSLAESIADRQPHLVALQEVFAYECIDFGSGTCAVFHGAFNDHLALTMSALDDYGADYYVAADVQNLTIPTPAMDAASTPGLPVYLPGIEGPAMFVRVIDRDVILARGDITTSPVEMNCARPEPDGSGCNYTAIATVTSLAGPIAVERGFVAVDAWVNDAEYRFVNTHLEVRFPSEDPMSTGLQAAQATELNFTLATNPSPEPDSRLIVAGDINSAPAHEPVGPLHPPYRQFSQGLTYLGTEVFAPMVDVWLLRPGNSEGFTCCEAADLLNAPSENYERIDVVFAQPAPVKVKANVMDADTSDKTASGLWPSDHASVIAELTY